MGLTMHERHALVRELSSRFQLSGKKERSAILTNFVQLTGYSRCYAAYVLRTCGSKQVRLLKGKRVVFIPGYARRAGAKRHRRGRYRTRAFLEALRRFWALSDGLCGKRLVAFLREIIPLLERQRRRVHQRPSPAVLRGGTHHLHPFSRLDWIETAGLLLIDRRLVRLPL